MSGDVLNRVLVIGISGTTNSGKTTLVRKLLEKYRNSSKICQDDFFLPPGDPRLAPIYIPELNHHNWEDYRALEMDKMVKSVKDKIRRLQEQNLKEQAILFVEGFCIFGWGPLLPLFDKKYFINVSREVSEGRRSARHYNPPDVPGYFKTVVWPEHLKHLEFIKDQQDIAYVDGNDGVERLYNLICSDINSLSTSAR